MSSEAVKRLLSEKWPEALSSGALSNETVFSTGVPEFNGLLPGGGLPRGQWLEITGDPGSGKTSFLFALLSGCAPDELILYLDLPRQFFPAAAQAAGVRLTQVRCLLPTDLQDALGATEAFLLRRQAGVVVIDLVGQKGTMPQARVHRLRQETVRSGALLFLLTEPTAQVVMPSTVAMRVGVMRKGASCTISLLRSRMGGEGARLVWSRSTR